MGFPGPPFDASLRIVGLLAMVASANFILCGCASPLIKAAEKGDQQAVARLLAAGADVNAVSADLTPLVAAALSGRSDMVGFLVMKGAKPDLRAGSGWTPLLAAIYSKHADAARALVNSGAVVTVDEVNLAATYVPDLSYFLNKNLGGRAFTQAQLQIAVSSAIALQAKGGVIVPKSDVDSPTYTDPERPNDYAIVVGIEKYADPDMPRAIFAEHDVAAIRAHFIALGIPPRNVKVLEGARATKSEIAAYVEQWLPSMVKPTSHVFFYFSGHGAPAADSHEAYLVPFDGDPEYLPDTAYPMKKLYVKLNSLPVKKVVIALDTCFSGLGGRSVLAPGTRPLVTRVDSWLLGSGHVAALSASKSDQISGVLSSEGHGVFTYYFLKGLNGAALEKGHVTFKGLYDYLKTKVADAAARQNRNQTPQLLPQGVVDFRLR